MESRQNKNKSFSWTQQKLLLSEIVIRTTTMVYISNNSNIADTARGKVILLEFLGTSTHLFRSFLKTALMTWINVFADM